MYLKKNLIDIYMDMFKQNYRMIILVIVLVILGIVSFNAWSLWYINAQKDFKAGVGMGASVGVGMPK